MVPPLPSPASHILNCLVQDEPGVLSRVSSTLAGRGFNIGASSLVSQTWKPGTSCRRRLTSRPLLLGHHSPDSLVVCKTEIRDLSRMCIVIRGQDGTIEQARRTLEDLVRCPRVARSGRRGIAEH
jgi:acetolactate synthase small subunit